jgi:hypothetical protein
MTSQALTVHTNGAPTMAPVAHERAFEPGSLPEAMQLAQVLYAGRMLPKHLATPEAVVTAIVMGRELGLSAMQSVRGIHVIEGKPTLSADMMGAVIQRSPVCEYFRMIESTDQVATYETKRRGHSEPTRLSFTIKEAEAARLTGKDNWQKFRAAMLRARCSSALGRIVYPDLLMGVYDPDELEPQAPPPVRINAPDAIDSTADDVTGQAYPLPQPEPKAETPWDKANKRLRAIAGKAAKRYGIPTKSIAIGLTHLFGGKSSTTLEPETLHEWADAIDADPSVLANAVTAASHATDDDVPPFDPSEVTAGEIDGDNMAAANA